MYLEIAKGIANDKCLFSKIKENPTEEVKFHLHFSLFFLFLTKGKKGPHKAFPFLWSQSLINCGSYQWGLQIRIFAAL